MEGAAEVEVLRSERASAAGVELHAEARDHARVYMAGRDLNIFQAPEAPLVVPPAGSRAAAIVDTMLAGGFEPPPLLQGLVARAKRNRWVSVTGSAGSGKSTLLAALTRPLLSPGTVPDAFLHAIVFCDETTTAESLGLELRDQLLVTVTGFDEALRAHHDKDPDAWQQQIALTRYVAGPLAELGHDDSERTVLVAVDGLDQLGADQSTVIPAALGAMADDDALSLLRLVVTHREPELEGLPQAVARQDVDVPAPEVLSRYLAGRRIPGQLATTLADLCSRARSAWLAARLLADVHAALDADERREIQRLLADGSNRAAAVGWLYDRRFGAIPHWDDEGEAGRSLRAVLTALTAVGTGPIAPLRLVTAVVAAFGGPDSEDGVRRVLDDLDRLVTHIHPESDRELVGLFHPTLVEHLARQDRHPLDVTSGRRALLEEIDRLAPVTGTYTGFPLYRWAAEAQAEHLWQLGMPAAALRALRSRPLSDRRENLERWTRWCLRFAERLGADDRLTLGVRCEVAAATEGLGGHGAGLRQYTELLPDLQRVLGPSAPETLSARKQIAHHAGCGGDAAGAMRMYRALAVDLTRILGPEDPETLMLCLHAAHWTGVATGDSAEALRLHRALLRTIEQIHGPDHDLALQARMGIATLSIRDGTDDEAGRQFGPLWRELARRRRSGTAPDVDATAWHNLTPDEPPQR